MGAVQYWIIAEVQRQADEFDAVEQLPTRGRRPVPGRSTSYSIRLDPDEIAALERRAEKVAMKPTALARNLIRVGLATSGNQELSQALDQVERAVEELRALVP